MLRLRLGRRRELCKQAMDAAKVLTTSLGFAMSITVLFSAIPSPYAGV